LSESNPIRLYVSHLYAPDEAYFRVFEYLESSPNFFYVNLATPDRPPRSKEKEALKEDLRRQINGSEVVVLLSSMYASDAALIEFQALYAKASDKPLIVLEASVRAAGAASCDWPMRSCLGTDADAIRRQARHEDTTRWDTIEFKLD
jgi:hypothetical protein